MVEQSMVQAIYKEAWTNSNGIGAAKLLEQVGDLCERERYLEAVAKVNPGGLLTSRQGDVTLTKHTSSLNVRFSNTILPVVTLENVPNECK